jgi:hypothetical protein
VQHSNDMYAQHGHVHCATLTVFLWARLAFGLQTQFHKILNLEVNVMTDNSQQTLALCIDMNPRELKKCRS